MSWYNDLHAGGIPGTEENTVMVDPVAVDHAMAGTDDWHVKSGHKDDGGGIQPWSKGEFYPWVWTCVDNIKAGRGELFYIHPDGRKSPIVRYGNQPGALSFREAHAILDDIMGAIIRNG